MGLIISREAFRDPGAAQRLCARLIDRGVIDPSQRDDFFALCAHIARRTTRHAEARIDNPGGYLRSLLERGREAWIDLPADVDRRTGAKLAAFDSGPVEPVHSRSGSAAGEGTSSAAAEDGSCSKSS